MSAWAGVGWRDVENGLGAPDRVYVAVPPGPVPARGWPLLVAFDGDGYAGFLIDATRNLGVIGEEIAPPLVVALGYGGEDRDGWHHLRSRDLTPVPPSEEDRASFSPDPAAYGRLDAYLGRVERLLAGVAAEHPVDRARSVLLGHSFGGLAVLHARFTRPELVSAHVAISPSIYWGGHAVLANERPTGQPLHLAVGELEETYVMRPDLDPAVDAARARVVARARIIFEARALADRLAAAGDPVTFACVAEETHVGVIYAALPPALRRVFPRDAGDAL